MSQPEVHLWRAVITQAIADASNPVRSKDPKQMRLAMNERDKAKKWLLGNTNGFRDVCELALLEPGAVRDWAQVLNHRGWPCVRRKPECTADTVGDEP